MTYAFRSSLEVKFSQHERDFLAYINATVHEYTSLKLLSFNSYWLQRLIVPRLPHYSLSKLGYNRTKSSDRLS